jgi:hypothetical protein
MDGIGHNLEVVDKYLLVYNDKMCFQSIFGSVSGRGRDVRLMFE